MNVMRRVLAFLLVAGAPLAMLLAHAAEERPAAGQYVVYAGTYTTKTKSKGIYAFRFDPATGKMTAAHLATGSPDPSWVAVHPSGKYLYAANEAGKSSMVSAYAIDAAKETLTLLNQLPSAGEDPCYLSLDKTGKYVFVANYTSGTIAVFPILPDGRLGAHTAAVKDWGAPGPNTKRQDGPHAHWIEASGGNGSVYVADLGLDRVLEYNFDAATATLAPTQPLPPTGAPTRWAHEPFSAPLRPGAGPRHVAFSRDGFYMYVLGELQSTVTLFLPEAHRGFANVQQISTLPTGFVGRNDAAEIALHPNGKFLFVSNRGHDSIAIFAINSGGGTLTLVGDVPTGGKEPRHFAIDPSGHYLLAENQFSDNIVEFRINPETGALQATGETVSVPSPVCIVFVAPE